MKSEVEVGTLTSANFAPFDPRIAFAAAIFPRPKALSSTKSVTVLPRTPEIPLSGTRSWVESLPERKTYLFVPDVTASFLAGPEM